MITTRTPLRISLFGGGTDMHSFYRHFGGAVISFAIDKYVYVSVNKKFDGWTRVSYSVTENVKDPAELKHDIVREMLQFYNLRGMEITSIADIPGGGTGLGSSSSFTVGLLAAISAIGRNGTPYCKNMLAETAYTIESNLCGHPVGKQDQYAATYGNLHYYGFNQDGTVQVQPMEYDETLTNQMMLFWTGISRSANEILDIQNVRFKSNDETAIKAALEMMKITAYMMEQFEKRDYTDFGKMLHLAWKIKRRINPYTANDTINQLYEYAIKAGAIGGKICGAGGGGFMLFVVPPEKQQAVREALKLREVPFRIEPEGAKVVYYAKTQTAVC